MIVDNLDKMMRPCKLKLRNILLFVCFCLAVTYIIKGKFDKNGDVNSKYNNNIIRSKIQDEVVLSKMQMNPNLTAYEKSLFWFVPQDIKYCEEILPKKVPLKTQARYDVMKPTFNKVLKKLSENIEGHSGEKLPQTNTYLHLASSNFVKTICETGFNAGHSTLAWLTGNRRAHVYSFDLGEHQYAKPMADFLHKAFPGRLTKIWGDSTVTLPDFIKTQPSVVCDLIVVDGGHSYELAKSDLSNFRKLANPNFNLLVLDDCPHGEFSGVFKAWQEMLRGQQALQHWQCYHKKIKTVKGFTIGKYIK